MLNRPLQLLAVAAGAGSILLAVLSSNATAQRPSYRNISQRSSYQAASYGHGCPCPCPTDDGGVTDAVPSPEGEDLPEVADLTADGGYASAPQSAVPNAIGDSMGSCYTGVYGLLTAPMCPSAGRFDISDNNSALPQHRVYYNYYYFNNALRPEDGANVVNVDVQRHELGFEYPFWCNMASIGVEVPYSHTINSTLDTGNLDLRDVEFGNVSVFLKGVLYQDCCTTYTAGLGVSLPTADDIRLIDGADELELENDVIVLSPFLAALYADPCSPMFVHGFVQLDIPTDDFGVTTTIGPAQDTINDPTVLNLDGSVGYWLTQDCCGNGVAAIAELHYTTNLDGNADALGGAVTLNNYDFWYATVGAHVANGCWNIRPALVLPLQDRPDRQFDWEASLQINRRF